MTLNDFLLKHKGYRVSFIRTTEHSHEKLHMQVSDEKDLTIEFYCTSMSSIPTALNNISENIKRYERETNERS